MADDDAGWIDAGTAALRLGRPVRFVYRLIKSGQLDARRDGRSVRIHEADLDALLEGARVRPGDLRGLYAERSEN